VQVAHKPDQPISSRSAGQSDVCGLCQLDIDDVSNLALAKCRHTFHRDCLETYVVKQEEIAASEAAASSKNKKKGKKRKADDENAFEDEFEPDDASKDKVKCPVCFCTLTVTLKLRDGLEDEEDKGAEPACVVCMDRLFCLVYFL